MSHLGENRRLEEPAIGVGPAPLLEAWSLPHDVLRHASCDADRVAVIAQDGALTYRALADRAADLASRLARAGVRPGDVVAVIVERSTDVATAALAAWWLGGVYLPIDAGVPPTRVERMLSVSQAVVAVARTDLKLPIETLRVGGTGDGDGDVDAPVPHAADDPAYAIFTSGSTGEPRCAVLSHGAFANAVAVLADTLHVGPATRVLQSLSLSFDVSIADVGMSLASGATLCVAPADALGGAPLARFIDAAEIEVMQSMPAVLRDLPLHPGPSLRTVVTGGEACPPPVRQIWASEYELFDFYGVTEAGLLAAVASDGRRHRPIPGVDLVVLDEDGAPTEPGEVGEITLAVPGGGRYVGADQGGYRWDEDGCRFRTGDLAVLADDGSLELRGRQDHQVKVRGHRVDCTDVEATLHRSPSVTAAAVVPRTTASGRQLVAYVVPSSPATTAAEIRSFLVDTLPAYMVPASIAMVDALPMTESAKIDRRALQTADPVPLADHDGPSNELESVVASIWADLLAVDAVPMGIEFVALGGDSLSVVELAEQVLRRWGTDEDVHELYDDERLTVAALAARLELRVPKEATTG